MDKNPYAPDEDLPRTLPIFPLEGVLLLPYGNLPLNIFEPRYLAMVEDALAGNRMIGMVQPRKAHNDDIRAASTRPVFDVGCAGKITEFSETADGRFLITLTGISRFFINEELETISGYRCVKPEWDRYQDDLIHHSCLDLDRVRLKKLLEKYFEKEGMDCNWQAIENAPDGKLITCLSMVCPFDPAEKQALLEAACCKTRAEKFMTMLEMAVREDNECDSRH